MDNALDMMLYTMPPADQAVTVKVAEFRGAIEHLERLVRSDWHACVNADERARCIASMKRVGAELICMVCKRATVEDMNRRERAIDRSASLVNNQK